MTLNKLCDEWLETYQKDHIQGSDLCEDTDVSSTTI